MTPLHLAVALDGGRTFDAARWVDLVQEAERGLLDFVTFDDSLGPQGNRLDAVLVAARVAPLTRHIGLVPTVTVTHTEPFHTSKAIATLDYVSDGRAGWQPRVSGDPAEAAHFGRRTVTPDDPDLWAEAADYVEVVRRLWDSWEDGAEIRDAATGRFIDRDRLHYIDFHGRWFAVKGPSITPRPPQGQPLVAVAAHDGPPVEADVTFTTPAQAAGAAGLAFADLAVGGTSEQLADELLGWQAAGVRGFRLRPTALPDDLTAITRGLVPALQARGAFRRSYPNASLRGLLGLGRPANRYARSAA